jgi:hypothetical protein
MNIYLVNQAKTPLGISNDGLLRIINEYYFEVLDKLWPNGQITTVEWASTIPENEIVALFLDGIGTCGDLAYHDFQPNGLPIIKIDATLGNITQNVTHELAEMRADPACNLLVYDANNRICAYENVDPVQGDTFKLLGFDVSNVVTPSYFWPNATNCKLDWMDLVKKPFEIRPGGYMSIMTPNGSWTQVDATNTFGLQENPISNRHDIRASRLAINKLRNQRMRLNDPIRSSE